MMDNLKSKYSKLVLLVLLAQFTSQCQKMKDPIPEFHTEVCSPDEKYKITPVYDHIKTLEGTPAGLPYGSSCGDWGSSGKMWTEQHGTPIGFDFTYYSRYENKYYHINADFDVAFMKDRVDRCYAGDDENSIAPVKEYIYNKERIEIEKNDLGNYCYNKFGDLVFGFAPQGMVVVWMRYGGTTCIDIGRFQGIEVTDEKKIAEYKKSYISRYRIDESRYDEAKVQLNIPNASCKPWDDFRTRYNWNYQVTSDNSDFKLFYFDAAYFNGENESLFRPTVLNPAMKKRAIPEMIRIDWETSAKDHYTSKLFFDWEKMNEILKQSGEQNTFQIHISADNSKVEIMLNNQKIDIDSIRVYSENHLRYRESYK